MPELPEVETMVRGIRPSVEGRVVADVDVCPCDCKPILLDPTIGRLRKRIRGCRVDRVYRLAKRVVLEFETGDRFVVEPRMTGLMLVADPPSAEHLRLRFDLADPASGARIEDGGSSIDNAFGTEPESILDPPSSILGQLWFWDRRGLGTARLYSPERFERELGPTKLGPDALEMTADEWWSRSRSTKRAIKVAMLDQRFVAGIGNLYASEILHLAGVRPTRRADRIARSRIERIHAMTLAVLREAIRYEGSTLGDGTYRNALNQDGGYQNHHRVYAHADAPCPTCASPIRRIVQAQRSTFFCPTCQR